MGKRSARSIIFQSTPSVWRETEGMQKLQPYLYISIHSLRVEGDDPPRRGANREPISIHSLRVEGDGGVNGTHHLATDFNPLPPCGGRLKPPEYTVTLSLFQSTPSVWRETVNCWCRRIHSIFQSTPSVWRETVNCWCRRIHSIFQSTPSVWRETHPQKSH